MGLTVVLARLNDRTPKALVTTPAPAKLTAKIPRAGNVNAKDGKAHERSQISAVVKNTTATGGIFNSRACMASHELRCERRAKKHIKSRTETGPPKRHSGIFDEPVMDEVKDSVPDDGAGD